MALAQLMLFLALFLPIFGAHGFIQPFTSQCPDQKIHKQVFYSPPFAPSPGEVLDKFYHGIPFPKGHVGIRNFNAEVVDEHGNSIPLHEVYLHHWVVVNYYVKKGEGRKLLMDSVLSGGNDGVCPHHMLSQFWGLGSETRHTDYSVPPPYAIPTGDPKKIPEGYEEAWLLNVHAIDTRGAVDPKGCFECRCDLYNISRGSTGQPVPKNYKGGLFCCQDGAQCLVKEGFRGEKRTLYLRYTIEWVEWDECVVPVRSYIFDATYDGKFCKIEYNTPLCSEDSSSKTCTHILEAQAIIPKGGNLIYAVAHQHSGGIGATLYGQDGRELCTSTPLYGTGRSPGNEKGYIVGMGSCYPENGSAKINDNEVLRVQSRYSTLVEHTGVMGLFGVLIADDPTSPVL